MGSIGIHVDDSAWQAAMDRLKQLVEEATFSATLEAAGEVQTRTRALLLAQHHGFSTQTPSAPGSPPAAISGDLAGSILVTDDGDSAFVGPTTDYGREQELGGPMKGHPMRWMQPPGVWHSSYEHPLPPRPYLKPATESAIADGSIERIYYDAWLRAIMSV